jgi:hypothetical protein
MPTLYIIFNDMSSLGRFFSRSRFKLSFMSIHYSKSTLEGEPLRIPPSNGRLIFDRAPCLPFSGGIKANALRPRGHTPLDSPDNLFSATSSSEQIVGMFYPSGEQSDDLIIRSMSSRAKRGDLMSLRTGMGLPLSLLSSQRCLQQPRLVNNPG